MLMQLQLNPDSLMNSEFWKEKRKGNGVLETLYSCTNAGAQVPLRYCPWRLGAFIALDRFDILKDNARKPLNSMVYYVFIPALLSRSLAKTLTLKSLIILWFMPINIPLSFTIGTAFGWLVAKITRTPRHMKGLVLGCCSAGNMGTLPLIIVPAICKESHGAFGDVQVCYRNGLAYASLSLAIGAIYVWCYVYNIVRAYICESSNVNRVDDSTAASISATERELVIVEKKSQENDRMAQLEIECSNGEAKVPENVKIMKQLKMVARKINLKALFQPSITASIVVMVLGIVAPFRKLLIGDHAPLYVVQDSASMNGDAAIPAITLLIGVNLLESKQSLRCVKFS